MSTQIQRRRGTTAEHSTFTGVEGELTVDTTKDTAVVHDGTTVGGHPLQKQYPPLGSAAAPTYTFTGDTNTGIYSPGADQVAVATNGTGRLFINSTGDIQVGAASTLNGAVLSATADPASKNLYLAFNGTTTGADFLMGGISANANGTNIGTVDIYRGSSDNHGYISFRTKNGTTLGERLRITSAGLVGIGTSSPASKLVVSNAGAEGWELGSTSGTVELAGYNRSTSARSPMKVIGQTFLVQTGNPSLVNGLYQDSSGRVGVGTTSPNTKLEIRGDSAGSVVELVKLNNNAVIGSGKGVRLGFGLSDSPTASSRAYIEAVLDGSNKTYLAFATNNGSGVFERARLDGDGRLLVGTSSSYTGYNFQVEGTAYSSSGGTFKHNANSAATGAVIKLIKSRGTSVGSSTIVQNDDRCGNIIFAGTDGSGDVTAASIEGFVDGTPGANDMPGRLVFSTTADGASSPTERMRIDSSGRVGIGTTSPDTLLNLSSSGNGYRFKIDDTTNNHTVGIYSDATSARIVSLNNAENAYEPFAISAADVRFWIGNTERARIDSSGRLLVGTSSAVTGGTSQFSRIVALGNSAGATNPGVISIGMGAVPASGNSVGRIFFVDNAAGEYADITAQCDGTPGSGSYPGRLVFSTTAAGAPYPTERWRIDSSGSLVGVAGSAFVAPYVYNTTTATAANVNVDASGFLRRSTSSIKYKTNVETIQDQYADAILGCRPVWYQSTCEADKPDWGHWGFIAEEVAEIDPRLCFFKEEEDGTLEPEGVQYDRFVPHLLNLIKRQQQAIETLEGMVAVNNITIDEQQHQLSTLAARLTALESA
jgi:hypothetical protein